MFSIVFHRRKDGTGDAFGFKKMLRENGLPLDLIPRYVGNRFHIDFHLAGIVFRHRAMLEKFCEPDGESNAGL